MRQQSFARFLLTIISVLLMLAAAYSASAQTFTVINTFNDTDGAQSMSALIFDSVGNLYGTTSAGGLGNGVVFELVPNGTRWTETVLYKFGSQTDDGANPIDRLVFDANGNLYGTTEHGGTQNTGTVFELSPASGGGWTETILHNFGSVADDGANPIAGLTFDDSGNLYGTTFSGGSVDACTYSGKTISCGTVFELSPVAGGGWTYQVIHDFSDVDDGYFPVAGLTLGPDGNLYGEASNGYTYGKGLLYSMVPGSDGTWTEKHLHPWGNVHEGRPDGGYPYSSVIFDPEGHMYGTSNVGGTHGDLGTVFKFTLIPAGWDEMNLHGFGDGTQGSYPEGSLLIDSEGNLYGTTYQGGTKGYGTVYELIPEPNGGYGYGQLYNFTGKTDGAWPTASLVMDSLGNLYGTAPYGGNAKYCTTATVPGCGVVFKITPK
jgi:uncharacterized repeat protein (TIGR03803 family)